MPLLAEAAAQAQLIATRAPRPTQKPASPATGALLAEAGRAALPEGDAALPEVLLAHAAQFLAAIVNEPCMATTPLAAGAVLPAQDQMLGAADQMDAVARAIACWTLAVESAEAAGARLQRPGDVTIDGIEDYDGLRAGAHEARDRTLALLANLRAACDGLTAIARKGA